jgi:putative nucleotidyltransferase with HDIG domain
MDQGPEFKPSPIRRIRNAWHTIELWMIFIAGLVGMTIAVSIPIAQRQSTYGLSAGDVAPQDILAPYALSYKSDVLTEQAKQSAANAVTSIYDPPSSQVARNQLDQLRSTLDYIDAIRADEHATANQKLEDLASLSGIQVAPETAQAVLDLPDARWKAVKSESISVLEQVMRTEIRPERVDAVRRTVPALVSITMPQDQADLVVRLVSAFVAPNAQLNEAATQTARDQAAQAETPVIKSYAAGETIISRGQIVTPLQLEALGAYDLLTPPEPWKEVAIRSLLVAVLGISLVVYGFRTHPEQMRSVRLASTLTLLLVVFTLGLQVMVPGRTVMPYLFPAATLPMLLAILFSPGMGVMGAIVSGALAGFLGARGLELGLYVALSGIMGALMIGQAERLATFFWSGLSAALAAVAIVVIFRFPDPATDTIGKASLMGAGLLNGFLSASLAFGLLLLIGSVVGLTTNLQLIELSRPDHPLLQFILRNAPGTYQHSLQVANLAEQAARAIGANSLLTRVGALYHDAGKALRPQFFIENQVSGQNIHQQLDPATSAGIILAHVKDGLDLAKKYRLPAQIQAFIPEHHGKLEAGYQYQAALDAAGGDESKVDRKAFAYPGPRPRSKETALLMLADGVEAKARADMPKDDSQIEELVQWVIQNRLTNGQLDRTNLTLKDLDTIRRSFVSTLKGIYHPRIRYPESDDTPEAEKTPESDKAGEGESPDDSSPQASPEPDSA